MDLDGSLHVLRDRDPERGLVPVSQGRVREHRVGAAQRLRVQVRTEATRRDARVGVDPVVQHQVKSRPLAVHAMVGLVDPQLRVLDQRGRGVVVLAGYEERGAQDVRGHQFDPHATTFRVAGRELVAGEVLDALDRLKIANDTLVVFSSDNGPARASRRVDLELMYDTATGAGWGIAAAKGITGGRKGYKSALFQGGIGVPFIARWPGRIPAGEIDAKTMISAVDLLPTFCEAARVTLPSDYKGDGISQLAALLGTPSSTRRKPLFWKMDSAWPIPKDRPYHWVSYAVVDDQWKLLTNRDHTYHELYDLSDDPYEKSDLADQKPEVVKELLGAIESWRAELPANPTGEVFSRLRAN